MNSRILILALLASLTVENVAAQAFTTDVSVTNSDPDVLLIDEDADATDWTLCVDSGCAGPAEGFNIAWEDAPAGLAIPFSIETGTPNNLLYLGAVGSVGINTAVPDPASNLHVAGGNVLLDPVGTAGDWFINPGSQGLWFVNDDGSPTNPVKFQNDAPSNSLVVAPDGRVGLGSGSPAAALEIQQLAPDMQFTDASNGSTFGLEYSNAFLRLKGRDGQDLGKIHTQAPVGTFTTDAQGRTGYGTANPAASFNVKYRGAHGAVPIFLAQAANNDEIFRINLNGNAVLEGTLTENSDVNAKTNIQRLDYEHVLQALAGMDIHRWQYKDAQGVDHIGPMAQDFRAAFGLGDSDTQISSLDTSGVALAAIRALDEENQNLKFAHRQVLAAYHQQAVQIAELQAHIEELEAATGRIAILEKTMAELMSNEAAGTVSTAR